MAFRRSDLQEAFFVPGTHAFRVWGYGTADPLEAVLAPGYFALARSMLRPGELIYVSTVPAQAGGVPRGEARLAMVMVCAEAGSPDRAAGSVRLVQDFGRPTDPVPETADAASCAPAVPVKRGRGRPPGSRTKKPAQGSTRSTIAPAATSSG
jgi:hypothetical protein